MKFTRLLSRLTCVLGLALLTAAASAAPLRVFIRGGVKSHGPDGNGVHDHLLFLKEWMELLKSRGCEADGGIEFPTDEQLGKADVMVMYAQEGGNIPPERRAALDSFLKRGGGLVVIHTAAVSADSEHWKSTIGGSWVQGKTKWREGPMDLYYVDNQDPVAVTKPHPITKGASNFHLDDEIYYDMDISPDVHVLATSYTPKVPEGRKPAEGGKAHIYDIQPQMWTYEKDNYRAFVSIPGHLIGTFHKPNYRAVLLRGITWVAKRDNVDELLNKEELASLTYPEGGPQHPADTLKNLEVHPDFNLTLVASEPLINKPMNFDWDPSGRMWVAETPEYPNGRRGMRPDYRGKEWKDRGGIDQSPGRQERKGLDRISILTDTNGDGVADKKDVFYDGLDLVTGLVFHGDGVIVTQAPDILWLRDKDGDGKAETVEKLYTNLGTGDTHAVINNPRRGWDGWIYATHGYSASNKVKNAKDELQENIGSGVVRFLPDGSKIEQYSSKGGNTWGLEITGDNRVMWTQPTSGTILQQTILPEYALARGKWGNTPSFNVVIGSPKSWPLLSWEQLAYVQIDFVGSFTATAGCVVYDGGSWPAEYNGDYFTTEPTINIIHHERLTPKGSSFAGNKLPGREQTEFIRSKDMWWRPIEVRVGPDGAVYISDFYNQAVIHNDTRGPDHNQVNAAVRPDRDHYFGRIWRLDHKQAKKLDVPDLSKANADGLAAALNHPNRHVRMNASRLLASLDVSPGNKPVPGSPVWKQNYGVLTSEALAADASKPAESRIAAMWTLTAKRSLDEDVLTKLLQDKNADVRRNAALIVENKNTVIAWGEPRPDQAAVTAQLRTALVSLLADADGAVRLSALRAFGASELSEGEAKAIVAAWEKFDDDWQKSAAVGALTRNSPAAIAAILDSSNPSLAQLAGILVQSIGERSDTAAAAKLVVALGAKPASADALKRSILETLARSLKTAPEMTPEIVDSLTKLLGSGASGAALPIAAKWDKAGALKGATDKMVQELFGKLNAGAEGDRVASARALIGLRAVSAEALPAVTKLVGDPQITPVSKREIIAALAETGEESVGPAIVAAFPGLDPAVQTAGYEALLKRASWAGVFLDAVKAKKIDPAVLGPANLARLRTHPDKEISRRANEMLDELNPMAKQKNEVIAKLMPLIDQPADLERGKILFTTTCGLCHKFGNFGADVGPGLTGMGAHGSGELLTAIVDPNREVDPSFVAWNIEKNDGTFLAGVIARENPQSVLLRFQGGEVEVKTADIKTRTNTGRSLMPEGFDALPAEILRDVIAYMQSVDGGKFRTVDLSSAFTASTSQGLYVSQEETRDSFQFTKTGTVQVEGVPFSIVNPAKAATGRNIIVLKGGQNGSFAKSMPQRVEAKLGGFKANRLHFLGGVTGWGWPGSREKSEVFKVTVHTSQGQRETFTCKNGEEFADYIGRIDVPGSKYAPGLVKEHQLRWFTKGLANPVQIDRITLESTDGDAAPTIVAVTAELSDTPLPETPKTSALEWKGQGAKVLLVGGGSSHDFQKWFNEADTALLTGAGWSVAYTEDGAATAAALPEAKVAVLSVNAPAWATPEARRAVTEFSSAEGKGLVLLHAGLWYNFNDWPDYNRVFAGGGSRGHDRLGEFTVTVSKPDHAVFKDVPQTFNITDELYWFEPSAAGGSPIEILATAHSAQRNKDYPMVWTVGLPKCRTIGITLGHDGSAHKDNPAFRKLLTNAIAWAAGK